TARRDTGTGSRSRCASSSGRSRRSSARAAPARLAAERSFRLVLSEDELDHVLDRRVLDRQIEHVQIRKQSRGDARCLELRDAKSDAVAVAMDDLAVRSEWRGPVLEDDPDRLVRRELLSQSRERAVEEDPPVVDHDHALAE